MPLTPKARERRRTTELPGVDDECCYKCCRDSIAVCGEKCTECGKDCRCKCHTQVLPLEDPKSQDMERVGGKRTRRRKRKRRRKSTKKKRKRRRTKKKRRRTKKKRRR